MVHKATGVAIVEEKLETYPGSFLFSLSVVFDVDIPKLQLGAHAADAGGGEAQWRRRCVLKCFWRCFFRAECKTTKRRRRKRGK